MDVKSNDYLDGIRYAIKNGAHILNASFTCRLHDPTDITNVTSAFNIVNSDQVLHVASVGNLHADIDMLVDVVGFGERNIFYFPAEMSKSPLSPNVNSVAATNQNDELASFSNFGQVDIAAPGSFQPTTFANGTINLENGTSMSAPLVSGTAALILAEFPEFIGNPESVKSKILLGADRFPSTIEVKKGRRLNTRGALDTAPE